MLFNIAIGILSAAAVLTFLWLVLVFIYTIFWTSLLTCRCDICGCKEDLIPLDVKWWYETWFLKVTISQEKYRDKLICRDCLESLKRIN